MLPSEAPVEPVHRKMRALRKPDWRVRVAKGFYWLVVTSAVFIILILLLITIGNLYNAALTSALTT